METVASYLNALGKSYADFALPMLIQSTILILLLLALDLALRKKVRAIVRYAIWMLILVKLILPPSFTAPTGLGYYLSADLPTITPNPTLEPSIQNATPQPTPLTNSQPTSTPSDILATLPPAARHPERSEAQSRDLFPEYSSRSDTLSPSPRPSNLAIHSLPRLPRRPHHHDPTALPKTHLRQKPHPPIRPRTRSAARRPRPMRPTNEPPHSTHPKTLPQRHLPGSLWPPTPHHPHPTKPTRQTRHPPTPSHPPPRTRTHQTPRPIRQPRPNPPTNPLLLQPPPLASQRPHQTTPRTSRRRNRPRPSRPTIRPLPQHPTKRRKTNLPTPRTKPKTNRRSRIKIRPKIPNKTHHQPPPTKIPKTRPNRLRRYHHNRRHATTHGQRRKALAK